MNIRVFITFLGGTKGNAYFGNAKNTPKINPKTN